MVRRLVRSLLPRPALSRNTEVMMNEETRPERYSEPSRSDTMPSQPSLQVCLKTISPSHRNARSVRCSDASELGLVLLDRQPPQVVTVELDQVKGAQDRAATVLVSADQLEHRKSVHRV